MPGNDYIAIEGPIGVGKTTLARLMQAQFGAQLLLEGFEENPFLKDFYADRARYAFQTQVFFILGRYQQQTRALPGLLGTRPVISDYTFAKDRLFAQLNLQGDELGTYERLYSVLAENIILPDLVVYLYADTPILIERIALRDRTYERSISAEYIESLVQAYEMFFAQYSQTAMLRLNTHALDIVHRPVDLEEVLQRVRSALRHGTHQMALPQFKEL